MDAGSAYECIRTISIVEEHAKIQESVKHLNDEPTYTALALSRGIAG